MAIYYENISIDVVPFLRILKLLILQHVNRHASMHVEGIIAAENCENKLFFTNYADQPISLSIDGVRVFQFLICQMKFLRTNDVTTVIIDAVSSSVLMDREMRSRSFQNTNIAYQDIFDSVGGRYSLSNVITCKGAKSKIKNIIIQYNETDWEFYLRMASHLGVFAFVAPKGRNPLIYIDKQKTEVLVWEDQDYSIIQNSKDDFAVSGIYDEIYPLGQEISLNGKTFYLKSSQLFIQNSQLKNHCLFVSGGGLTCPRSYNETIVGAALMGTVFDVKGTQIKIKLQIDKGDSPKFDNTHWFGYMSVYSSSGGNSWYFMPEIGDSVYLKVPEKKEETAYAAGAVHVTDTTRDDPEIKFIKTKDGKIIRFTPDEIDIMVTPQTYIKLYDEGGIDIMTNGNINFTAGKNINIKAKQEVSISGKKRVTIKKGASKIVVSDNIIATGKKVKLV